MTISFAVDVNEADVNHRGARGLAGWPFDFHELGVVGPDLIAEIRRKVGIEAFVNVETVLPEKLFDDGLCFEAVIAGLAGEEIVTGDAENLGLAQGLGHAANCGALGAFDVHLQEVNPAEVKLVMNLVNSGGSHGNSARGVYAVGQISVRVLDHGGAATAFGDSHVNGDDVVQVVIGDEFFEAAIGERMGLDADDLAVLANGARKS